MKHKASLICLVALVVTNSVTTGFAEECCKEQLVTKPAVEPILKQLKSISSDCGIQMTSKQPGHVIVAQLSLNEVGEGKFLVTNSESGKGANKRKFSFHPKTGKLETEPGVPFLTRAEILEQYGANARQLVKSKSLKENDALAWEVSSDHCSPDEAAMIMFFVYEWFYFG